MTKHINNVVVKFQGNKMALLKSDKIHIWNDCHEAITKKKLGECHVLSRYIIYTAYVKCQNYGYLIVYFRTVGWILCLEYLTIYITYTIYTTYVRCQNYGYLIICFRRVGWMPGHIHLRQWTKQESINIPISFHCWNSFTAFSKEPP